MAVISGTFKDANGNVIDDASLVVTATESVSGGSQQLVEGSVYIEPIISGAYSMTMRTGTYKVEVINEKQANLLGVGVVVGASTPNQTMTALLAENGL